MQFCVMNSDLNFLVRCVPCSAGRPIFLNMFSCLHQLIVSFDFVPGIDFFEGMGF